MFVIFWKEAAIYREPKNAAGSRNAAAMYREKGKNDMRLRVRGNIKNYLQSSDEMTIYLFVTFHFIPVSITVSNIFTEEFYWNISSSVKCFKSGPVAVFLEVGPVGGARLLSVELSDVVEIVGARLLRLRLRKLTAGSWSRGRRRSFSGDRGWRCGGRTRPWLPRGRVTSLVIGLFSLLLSAMVMVAAAASFSVPVEGVQCLIVGGRNAGTRGVIWNGK